MTRFAFFAVVVLLAAGCSSTTPVPKVAMRTATPLPAGTVVVSMPRVCLDVQLDNSRRQRGRGDQGLPRTRGIDIELKSALHVNAPRSWDDLKNGCGGSIYAGDPRAALETVRPSPDVLAKMRSTAAKRAIVTQISTRLICPTESVPWLEQLGYCYEDEVSISVAVFDESGRALHVAEIPVEREADARSGVHSLLETFHYAGCHLVREGLLECADDRTYAL